MANNTIGWGQGATNNNIGWGRGSSNDIGWGSVYENSYVGDTDIIGGDTRFIITVKTDNAGTSLSNQFTLPWIGTYDVEWGDGSSDVGVSGTQTHTYASAGTYDVAVTATTGMIFFNNGGDRQKLLDIKNWGAIAWTSFDRAFFGCTGLTIVSATDAPNMSGVITMFQMLRDCSSLVNIDVSLWDTSSVLLINNIFQNCSSLVEIDVSNWDVSSANNSSALFFSCTSLQTVNVSNWDTSSVFNMAVMFLNCTQLKADFSGLDIASVTNFSNFAIGTNINETGTTTNYDNTLISWAAQTPQNNIVINFGGAKYSWRAIEARNTLVNDYNWTITDGGIADDDEFVITVRTTSAAETFTIPTTGGGYNYNVNWGDGTSTVGETGNATHEYATAGDYDIQITGTFPRIYFNNTGDKAKLIDIKNWGNGAWTSMERSFFGCTELTVVSAEDAPNLSIVTALPLTFRDCANMTSLNVANWDTSNLNSISVSFFGCYNLSNLDVTNWDVSNVTTFLLALYNCDAFDYSLANWDITSLTEGTNFMQLATGLSTANYDATLIGWEANLQATYPAGSGYTASININFGGSQFTLGSAAETARTSLRNTFGWTITDGGGVSGVLNQYTGAAAAYSLRNLSTATTNVVRVRADVVGQPEQDFTYDEIMDGTLATFVGAGNNGYVVTWYDQSGNGNHATQGTAANQPQIVASGVVITENGMPAVQFDGVNDYLSSLTYIVELSQNNASAFAVSHQNTISLKSYLFSEGDVLPPLYSSNFILGGSPSGGILWVNTVNFGATQSGQTLIGFDYDGTNFQAHLNGNANGASGTALVNLETSLKTYIGTRADASIDFLNGKIQEIITYKSNQSANRANIEGNINGYYSIY